MRWFCFFYLLNPYFFKKGFVILLYKQQIKVNYEKNSYLILMYACRI